jgi:hypothetical protein
MEQLTIGQRLDRLQERYDAIRREMNALPNLDSAGIPNEPYSPEGQKWDELWEKATAISNEMCQLVINHKPGQQYPDPTGGE